MPTHKERTNQNGEENDYGRGREGREGQAGQGGQACQAGLADQYRNRVGNRRDYHDGEDRNNGRGNDYRGRYGQNQTQNQTQNQNRNRGSNDGRYRNNYRTNNDNPDENFHPRQDLKSLVNRRSHDTVKSLQRLPDSKQSNDGWESDEEAPVAEPEQALEQVTEQAAEQVAQQATERVESDPETALTDAPLTDAPVTTPSEAQETPQQTSESQQNNGQNDAVGGNFVIETNKKYKNITESIDDFEDMPFLSMELFEGIQQYGFKYPSPIQARTIHIINQGHDLIAISTRIGKNGCIFNWKFVTNFY